jgi:two-component system nitrogen regulation response regulator GlnG
VARQIGKFEQAARGTLFLDEIGDMPLEAQTRLLRALQSGRIRRVGGTEEIALDCRIIAATNRDLVPMIAAGQFREDLYYRLAVVPIELPPLRDRADDVEALSRHFLARRHRGASAPPVVGFRRGAARAPALARQRARIAQFHLPPGPARARRRDRRGRDRAAAGQRRRRSAPQGSDVGAAAPMRADFASALEAFLAQARPEPGTLYDAALAAFERPLFLHALAQTGGNQLRAAQCWASTATPCASAWSIWASRQRMRWVRGKAAGQERAGLS